MATLAQSCGFIADTAQPAAPKHGLKRAFYIDMGEHNLFVATDASDEEMEGRFLAWCLEEEEWLYINGWLIDDMVEEDGKDRDGSMAERRALGETALD